MNNKKTIVSTCAALIIMSGVAWATFNYFQGFEVNTGDWTVS